MRRLRRILMLVGVGYRRELDPWIRANQSSIDCLEITAEHFFGRGERLLVELATTHTLSVHGLGLSLGTPGPLDPEHLVQFARVVEIARPTWISEHVAFTRVGGIELGHLNPIPTTAESLQVLADHAKAIMDRCSRPLLLENITSHLQVPGGLPETEFLNQLCSRTGCGLLLDVTNLFINSRNHGFDANEWIRQVDPSYIRQMHIVGYAPGSPLHDSHGEPIQDELVALASAVARTAAVEAVILERDANFPPDHELNRELEKIERICATH